LAWDIGGCEIGGWGASRLGTRQRRRVPRMASRIAPAPAGLRAPGRSGPWGLASGARLGDGPVVGATRSCRSRRAVGLGPGTYRFVAFEARCTAWSVGAGRHGKQCGPDPWRARGDRAAVEDRGAAGHSLGWEVDGEQGSADRARRLQETPGRRTRGHDDVGVSGGRVGGRAAVRDRSRASCRGTDPDRRRRATR
jgi:hypothetical protein